ncbi:helix-turn-helix transcriptional regulator [Roseomonas terrae]|uniref:Helix-turn-helix transcriptional regulator n=1 Tax=Neoroseomonas terrae TaxID=424799 RepID=A0ABS5EET4_9PROT|nr:helix-turn-helix transcriptional regulator [Neoroseomonas terrae]MBR0649533.1 helix-turn-helix transcriptional regulator [Neoroseomonas terrae]
MNGFRQQLRDKGIRQADIAARLGVSEATVSKWLARKQAVPVSAVLPLADILGVEPSKLLAALSDGPPAAKVA